MTLNERIGSLANLGFALKEENEAKKYALGKAYHENKWFTEEQVQKMIDAICEQYLDFDKLSEFAESYQISDDPENIRTVGIIPAGNIPLVGFHDVLCILLSGHHARVKLSEKDSVLLPWVMSLLENINLELARQVGFVDKLAGFEAVIATGSNNSAQIFKNYFGKYPHIIRNNKTGIAILDGNESHEQLEAFADDVFSYYGLGCRNISKIYVPNNYNFNTMGEILNNYKSIVLHPKYKNNFDYNLAVNMLNKDKFINVASIILVEKENIHSRIASLHYQYYDNLNNLEENLQTQLDLIQCITSQKPVGKLKTFPFGQAQQPALNDFADGVDTMDFLLQL